MAQSEKGRLDSGKAASGPRQLTNPEKVAVLLLAMGKPVAERVLQHFDEHELTLVARHGANLGIVQKATLDGIVDEFEQILSKNSGLHGTLDKVEKLLQGVVPEDRYESILADLRGNSTQAVWSRLSELPEARLAQFLAKEHPQVVAVVLTKATPSSAAAVMGQMTTNRRHEVTRRMLAIKHVTDSALEILQTALNEDLLAQSSRQSTPDIHSRLANIINKLDRQRMEEVLSDLGQQKPKDTKRIRGLLFTFEDIAKLTPESRSKLIDQVPQDRLIIALKGADANMIGMVLASTGARARRMIEQEIAGGAPVPPKEVMKARRAIAELALDLSQRGEIDIGREGAEEEM